MASVEMRRVFTNEWFWLVIVVVAFGAALLVFKTEPCKEGFYWEQGFGCIRG